ncbi:MAG: ParB/RepB/Spo0J family partition protein [Candidatus Bathyarchaeota archaeon]|jgi:ParB/RepB/Spo0J family partition protein|nr:ParB/RepB/Spo0J family partition protein [Candidatus Bathyarchaeota archaeon]
MAEFREIELSRIRPNRLNPRLKMDIESLNDLAESIKRVGLIEPIIVRPVSEDYEVVVGERRYRASQQAGLARVPAIVRNLTDGQVVELNLIENLQREDLSAVEKGRCCKKLLQEHPQKYSTKQALGDRIGISAETISNWIKLTTAPAEIQEMIAPTEKTGVPRKLGKLDYTTALRITQRIAEPERQVEIAKEIADRPVHGERARKAVAKAVEEPEKSAREVVAEIIQAPHELIFTAADKERILKGLQTQTTRTTLPDTGLRAGSKAYATVVEHRFADLQIDSIQRKRLRFYSEEDAKAEGGYTVAEFKEIWIKKHGEWNENRLVYLISFQQG